MKHDPLHVADLLRWSRSHWQRDNTQPRDLDDLLERAAETLELTVSRHWRTVAAIEAIVLLVVAIWMTRT